jgi:hypothetical protein
MQRNIFLSNFLLYCDVRRYSFLRGSCNNKIFIFTLSISIINIYIIIIIYKIVINNYKIIIIIMILSNITIMINIKIYFKKRLNG